MRVDRPYRNQSSAQERVSGLYSPGDIANGFVLGNDGIWHPLEPSAARAPETTVQSQEARTDAIITKVVFGTLAVVGGLLLIAFVTGVGDSPSLTADEMAGRVTGCLFIALLLAPSIAVAVLKASRSKPVRRTATLALVASWVAILVLSAYSYAEESNLWLLPAMIAAFPMAVVLKPRIIVYLLVGGLVSLFTGGGG